MRRRIVVNYLFHLPKAVVANVINGFPSRRLKVIGVTGTKGKTTTAHLIYHLLQKAGKKVVLISTLVAKFGEEELNTGLHVTNPGPFTLQRLLKKAVDQGYQYLILEVTSHGLAQHRNWGIKFELGVFTQVAADHLLYHGGVEEYREAKSKLIKMSGKVLLNHHDNSRQYLEKVASKAGIPIIQYQGKKDDFQSQNQAAAIAAVVDLGISKKAAQQALRSFPGVTGRLEAIQEKPFMVVIDFAHTPESLAAVLKQLRSQVKKNGRLIAVFGCAGERDPGRRRMGAVAAKLADLFVITAEDPRKEEVKKISEEIAGYAKQAGAVELSLKDYPWESKDSPLKGFVRIPDRRQAINFAVAQAQPGDLVGLFGKGHEKSLCFGREEKPWSEHEAVKRALDNRKRK